MESISACVRSFPNALDDIKRTTDNKTNVFFIIVILSFIIVLLFVVAKIMKKLNKSKQNGRIIFLSLEFVLNFGQFIKNSPYRNNFLGLFPYICTHKLIH